MYKKKCRDCWEEFMAPHISTAYCKKCAAPSKKEYFKRYYKKNREKYKKIREQKLLESKTNNDKQS